VPSAAIADVVRQIARRFRPDRIVLFGSYAYGDPRPESDVDLLVVMDTVLRETEQAVDILQHVDHRFGLDLVVRTPESLARRLAMGDPFLAEVCERGRVMYERPCD
jgi:predicted nucleotidyltransferase